MERDLGGRIVNYLFGFLGERWPWLTSDPALLAMITGFILGGIIVGIIYWLVHKGRINELKVTVVGLTREVSFLERQKADLENKLKECLTEKSIGHIALPLSIPSETRRLRFEFSETELDHSNPNLLLVFVKVTNPTMLTITNVSVSIVSLIKVDEPEQSDIARHLEAIDGLPLMQHRDSDRPPHRAFDIHAHDDIKFDVVTLQRQPTGVGLHHAIWQETDYKGYWIQRPSGALEPGRYHAQLKAQGRDVPAETLSIEFENISGSVWIRPGKNPPSLS